MGGFRPWFVDSGPASASNKSIQLFQNAPMNERIVNLELAADVSIKNVSGGNITDADVPTITELMSYINALVAQAKLTVNGKTLWTLTAKRMFLLAMYKTRNVPTNPFIDGLGYSRVPGEQYSMPNPFANNATNARGKIVVPYYFNQPSAREPALFAPGVAQMKNTSLYWESGTYGAGTNFTFNGKNVELYFTNVRLIANFGFDRGYYVAPMAIIDTPNLANAVTPIAGGLVPNVLNELGGDSSATGEVKSYVTAYGEELHGVTPSELSAAFSENSGSIFDTAGKYFTPYKYTPPNAFAAEFLPSPNGESLEVTTAQASEVILVERYVPTAEFVPYATSQLGNIVSSNSRFVTTGLPGQIESAIPNSLIPYMPQLLGTV